MPTPSTQSSLCRVDDETPRTTTLHCVANMPVLELHESGGKLPNDWLELKNMIFIFAFGCIVRSGTCCFSFTPSIVVSSIIQDSFCNSFSLKYILVGASDIRISGNLLERKYAFYCNLSSSKHHQCIGGPYLLILYRKNTRPTFVSW